MKSHLAALTGLGRRDDSPGWARSRNARATSLAQIGDRVLNAVLKLAYIPLTILVLGQEKYGVWLTMLSIIAWFSMSDMGIPSALTNPLASAIGRKDKEQIRALISTTAFLLGIIGLLMVMVACALVFLAPLERALGMSDPSFNSDVRFAAIVVVVFNLGGLAIRLPDVIAFSLQKGYWSSAASIAGQFAGIIGLVALKVVGGSLFSFALCVVVPPVVARMALWVYLWRRFGSDFAPRFRNYSRQACSEVGRDGLRFFAGMWSELLVLQTPNIIVAQLNGASAVPLFSVPYQIFYSAFTVLNTIATPLWPAYAEAKANGDLIWLRRAHWRVMKESLVLAVLGFSAMGVLSSWLVRMWVGPSYAPSMMLSWLFAIHFIQWTWNYVFVVLLTGLGFIRERVHSVLILGPVNLVLSILLAQRFGIVGLAVAMLIAMLVTQTWFLSWTAFKKARWVFSEASLVCV